MEEISRRQKSRAPWLREGDKCTKLFHQVASSHRRKNTIEMLKFDGLVTADHSEIKEHVIKRNGSYCLIC